MTAETKANGPEQFSSSARASLKDPALQRALSNVPGGFIKKRRMARDKLPEFDALRDQARAIKIHTLEHLDLYLEAFEDKVVCAGGTVHWAVAPQEARALVMEICERAGARVVTKGKSMVSEEIDLASHMENAGLEAVETDLGEYLIQLRQELPSHIIAPAIHLNRDQIERDFRRHHDKLDVERPLDTAEALVSEARMILREKFLSADVGVTGANFLVAETGSSVIVTNEGNGDLTQTLPKVHIVIASIEKIVPTVEDTFTFLRLLARSATGQEISTYTTFSTGPRCSGDPDGPEDYHVVLVDNGRSALLGTEFREMLRCIRCGACMNHCPVYQAVGGHAYGWVYPGPMGSVLTPSLMGIAHSHPLPDASTFCGRCEAVCPVRIPLPDLLRRWRKASFTGGHGSNLSRLTLKVWAFFALRPRLYQLFSRVAILLMSFAGRGRGSFRRLPFAAAWTKGRDFPVPEGDTFMSRWKASRKAHKNV